MSAVLPSVKTLNEVHRHPSVSIITATCADHSLAFLNLYKSMKIQHYKNIKEWIVYNFTNTERQPAFEKFIGDFQKKYYLDISNNIELRILNNGPDRVVDRAECDVLNDLTAAATGDIVVVMTDRDQYSPIRVSSAVNALENKLVVFDQDARIYSLDKEKYQLFSVDTVSGTNNFTSSLAFKRSLFSDEQRFDEVDSIYDFTYGLIDGLLDEEMGDIVSDNSFMLYKEFLCDAKMYSYIAECDYSYALKRRIRQADELVRKITSNESAVFCASDCDDDECPICFSETKHKFSACKHTICVDCVKQLKTPNCPMCRNEFKNIHNAAWNMEYWEPDTEDEDEDDDVTEYTEDDEEENQIEDDDEEDQVTLHEGDEHIYSALINAMEPDSELMPTELDFENL